MKQKRILIALFAVFFVWQCTGHAADEAKGFFGIKKSVKKGIPANPAKKNIKGIPANASAKTGDSELTEEEKKMLKEMAEKAPKDKGETGEVTAKENVQLPPGTLATIPPKNPETMTPRIPSLPKDPNALIVRIPQPPARAPQNPNGLIAPEVPGVPGKKK